MIYVFFFKVTYILNVRDRRMYFWCFFLWKHIPFSSNGTICVFYCLLACPRKICNVLMLKKHCCKNSELVIYACIINSWLNTLLQPNYLWTCIQKFRIKRSVRREQKYDDAFLWAFFTYVIICNLELLTST